MKFDLFGAADDLKAAVGNDGEFRLSIVKINGDNVELVLGVREGFSRRWMDIHILVPRHGDDPDGLNEQWQETLANIRKQMGVKAIEGQGVS